ncbi:MAG TPA: porin family protein [Chitinophagaceae bacterium]|nr:porin family protein [Chitinophagaceae bacterium]
MKTILLAGLFSVSILSVTAQARRAHAHDDVDVAFGIKGGLNIANLHVENAGSSTADAKASFHAGGLAHIHITKSFALQPELMYSNQGYKYELSNTTTRLNLHYLNLPVLAQFMVGQGFRIESGPQLGFLLAARQKTNNVSLDVKNNFKTVDFGWAFGLGYVTPSGFGVDARYNVGISSINKASAAVNNRVFQAGVFYQFNNH